MLFLHETHKVIGRHASAFEDLYRNGWMGALALSGDARLLWYLDHAMGSGPAYQVVTITALADGRAWEDLAGQLAEGDLRGLAQQLDAHRYEVDGKLVVPTSWSALQEVDLASVPTDGREHGLSVYMHDTGELRLTRLYRSEEWLALMGERFDLFVSMPTAVACPHEVVNLYNYVAHLGISSTTRAPYDFGKASRTFVNWNRRYIDIDGTQRAHPVPTPEYLRSILPSAPMHRHVLFEHRLPKPSDDAPASVHDPTTWRAAELFFS